jgi:3-phenylpropionate/cinnamic acid dioxygenase small subunit
VTDEEALNCLVQLQSRYIRALARNDMSAWADCFDDPGSYVCMVRENEEQGLPIALMMDDSRGRILDRVKYVTEVWHGTFEDYSSRHIVQPIDWSVAASGAITAESNLIVAYTTTRGRSEMLATGSYLDEIVIGPAGAHFRSKKVVLDTTITPRYLVYPI